MFVIKLSESASHWFDSSCDEKTCKFSITCEEEKSLTANLIMLSCLFLPSLEFVCSPLFYWNRWQVNSCGKLDWVICTKYSLQVTLKRNINTRGITQWFCRLIRMQLQRDRIVRNLRAIRWRPFRCSSREHEVVFQTRRPGNAPARTFPLQKNRSECKASSEVNIKKWKNLVRLYMKLVTMVTLKLGRYKCFRQKYDTTKFYRKKRTKK